VQVEWLKQVIVTLIPLPFGNSDAAAAPTAAISGDAHPLSIINGSSFRQWRYIDLDFNGRAVQSVEDSVQDSASPILNVPQEGIDALQGIGYGLISFLDRLCRYVVRYEPEKHQ
jgi:hypothetical protein